MPWLMANHIYAHLTVIPSNCLTTCLLYYLPTIWLISATDLESGKLKPQYQQSIPS